MITEQTRHVCDAISCDMGDGNRVLPVAVQEWNEMGGKVRIFNCITCILLEQQTRGLPSRFVPQEKGGLKFKDKTEERKTDNNTTHPI